MLTYHGRSSTVFAVFIFFGSLFFAFGLGYRPEMAFVLYFALTFMDAIFSVNPRMPWFVLGSNSWFDTVLVIPQPSYYNANTFVVAAAVYVAVSIVSQIVIFPESYNHSWLLVFPRLFPIEAYANHYSSQQVREDVLLVCSLPLPYRRAFPNFIN